MDTGFVAAPSLRELGLPVGVNQPCQVDDADASPVLLRCPPRKVNAQDCLREGAVPLHLKRGSTARHLPYGIEQRVVAQIFSLLPTRGTRIQPLEYRIGRDEEVERHVRIVRPTLQAGKI